MKDLETWQNTPVYESLDNPLTIIFLLTLLIMIAGIIAIFIGIGKMKPENKDKNKN